MKWFTLLGALALGFTARAADNAGRRPDIRVSVQAESQGRERPNRQTTVSTRRLRITLENREREAIDGLQVDWKIIARDINSRRLSLAASGRSQVSLAAEEVGEILSREARFTEQEGKSKRVGKGKNKRTVTGPDTGTDYAGYVVEVRRNGVLVAEAATVGMKERAKHLGGGRK